MANLPLKATLHRALLLGGVWVVLGGVDTKALLIGAIVVPMAVWLSLTLIPATNPLHLWRFLGHMPSFVWGSITGGVDVAVRALSPKMRLRPGWVEVQVTLDEGARTALGNELSLMPGTLAAGSSEGKLLVHILDTEAGFQDGIPRTEAAIAGMITGKPAAGGAS